MAMQRCCWSLVIFLLKVFQQWGGESKKSPIWVCWLQGENKMPSIVKKCLESITNHSNGHSVNLITIDNYSEYIDIDKKFLQRYYNGTLLPAHLADLFRLKLLADYGGLWIDATIYLIKDLEDIYFNKQFFQ